MSKAGQAFNESPVFQKNELKSSKMGQEGPHTPWRNTSQVGEAVLKGWERKSKVKVKIFTLGVFLKQKTLTSPQSIINCSFQMCQRGKGLLGRLERAERKRHRQTDRWGRQGVELNRQCLRPAAPWEWTLTGQGTRAEVHGHLLLRTGGAGSMESRVGFLQKPSPGTQHNHLLQI